MRKLLRRVLWAAAWIAKVGQLTRADGQPRFDLDDEHKAKAAHATMVQIVNVTREFRDRSLPGQLVLPGGERLAPLDEQLTKNIVELHADAATTLVEQAFDEIAGVEARVTDVESGLADLMRTSLQVSPLLEAFTFDDVINRHNSDFYAGSREWIITEFESWAASTHDTDRVFWIMGGPGVGKSAIAAQLCAHECVAAHHFCRFDNAQLSDPAQMLRSLAAQLKASLPAYAEALAAQPNMLALKTERDLKTLFDQLLVRRCKAAEALCRKQRQAQLNSEAHAAGGKVVVLVDALDEARETDGTRNKLLELIADRFADLPPWVGFVVTSRPERDIRTKLCRKFSPLEIKCDDARNMSDVRGYLEMLLRPKFANSRIAEAEATLHRCTSVLEKKAQGLFLYAHFVRKRIAEFADGADIEKALDDFPDGLGGMYEKNFRRLFEDEATRKMSWEQVRPLIELIVFALEPLPLEVAEAVAQNELGWSRGTMKSAKAALAGFFPLRKGRFNAFTSRLTGSCATAMSRWPSSTPTAS